MYELNMRLIINLAQVYFLNYYLGVKDESFRYFTNGGFANLGPSWVNKAIHHPKLFF